MTYKSTIPYSPGAKLTLPSRDGLAETAHVFERDAILAINAALATGRPLLVRGEPGTGKSQLARAAAEALGRALICTVVDSQTETRDLLWTIDHVARLATAQALGAFPTMDPDKVAEHIALAKFVHPGALWWAFHWTDAEIQAKLGGPGSCFRCIPKGWTHPSGTVVLIDEIDKGESTVPNGLLDALGHGSFSTPLGTNIRMTPPDRPPLVLLTTNEERSLPDAFLRRCWVLHLRLPEGDALQPWLVNRGKAHFGDDVSDEVLKHAATLVRRDRTIVEQRKLTPPGQAEYLDLVRAVRAQKDTAEDQIELLNLISEFALNKHPPEPK